MPSTLPTPQNTDAQLKFVREKQKAVHGALKSFFEEINSGEGGVSESEKVSLKEARDAVFTLTAMQIPSYRRIRKIMTRVVKTDIEMSALDNMEVEANEEEFLRVLSEKFRKYVDYLEIVARIAMPCAAESVCLTAHSATNNSQETKPVWPRESEILFSGGGTGFSASVQTLRSRLHKVLFRIILRNKAKLIKALKNIVEKERWYEENFVLLQTFIRILGTLKMRETILKSLQKSIVASLLGEIKDIIAGSYRGVFGRILGFMYKVKPLFPSRFWKKVEIVVIRDLLGNIKSGDDDHSGTIVINFSDVADLKNVYTVFKKAMALENLSNLYLDFLSTGKICGDTGDRSFFLLFHWNFLFNRQVLNEFADKKIDSKVSGYFRSKFSEDGVVQDIAKTVDSLLKIVHERGKDETMITTRGTVNRMRHSGTGDIFDALAETRLKEIDFLIERNPGYRDILRIEAEKEGRRAKRVIIESDNVKRVKDCGHKDTPSSDASLEQGDRGGSSISKTENEMTGFAEREQSASSVLCSVSKESSTMREVRSYTSESSNIELFRIAFFSSISHFLSMSQKTARILAELQHLLSFRLLSGKYSCKAERAFLSYLPVTHSERMARMISDAEDGLSAGFTLMKMCKWPMFSPVPLELPGELQKKIEGKLGPVLPFTSLKEWVEKKLRKQGKRVQWIDSVSRVCARVNGVEREMTLHQYIVVLALSIGENISTLKLAGLYRRQFELLVDGGLVVKKEGGDEYFLNSSCLTKDFIPKRFELASASSQQENDGLMVRDQKSIIIAKIARVIKKSRSIEMADLRREVYSELADFSPELFPECLKSLEERGIVEIDSQTVKYIP